MPTRLPPIDIEIVSPLLPYSDLIINGDPQRNLHIPQDVNIVLAGLIGLSGQIPRMASMQETGALNVTESGGGLNDFESLYVNLGPSGLQSIALQNVCSLVYMRSDGARFSITNTNPNSLNNSLTLENGFQVMIPMQTKTFDLFNDDTVSGNVMVAAFFHNHNLPQPSII